MHNAPDDRTTWRIPSNRGRAHIIGRYSQGQHTLVTSSSQGQFQGQEGRCRFLAVFTRFREFLRHF